MIDAIEGVLLIVLPIAFLAKTVSLMVMGWQLNFRTKAKGPVGKAINVQFRDQSITSLFLTFFMSIIAREVDASEVEWPLMSLVLMGTVVWAVKTSWSHYNTYRTYRRVQKVKVHN